MTIIQKFLNFKKKNQGRVIKKLYGEFIGKIYSKRLFRGIIRPFFPIRNPEKWIFIVGCYNSGTTILRELLSSHPDISTLPLEGVRFTNIFKRPEDLGWVRNWAKCENYVHLPSQKNPELTKELLKDLSPLWNKKCKVFLEKSISNIPRMKWIDINLENVYFIGIIRNPYSVCEGIKRRAKPLGDAITKNGSNEYSFTDIANQWKIANDRMLENGKQVKFFKLISYEELTHDPERVLLDLFNYVGVNQIKIERKGTSLIIGKNAFMIKNMNYQSIQRLTKNNIHEINTVASQTMSEHNYNRL